MPCACGARGASAARAGFGFALNTAATFDVFHGLQVTNYGLFNVLFESAPNGSDHVDVYLWYILAQTASPNLFRGNVLATSPGESKLKLLQVGAESSSRFARLESKPPLPLVKGEADGQSDDNGGARRECEGRRQSGVPPGPFPQAFSRVAVGGMSEGLVTELAVQVLSEGVSRRITPRR